MLFTLSVLIPTVVFWYNNIKNYKKIELINNCLSNSIFSIKDANDIKRKYLIANINLSNVMITPAIKSTWSNFAWIGLRTEYYKQLRITSGNDFYPFRNESKLINEYIKTTLYHSNLNQILGVNINPIFSKLIKKYGVQETPIMINNNNNLEEIEIGRYCDGSLMTKKELSTIYYNSGIVYDIDTNYTIMGKVDNGEIDPSNSIVEKQNTLNIDEIKNRYINKINTNNSYLLFFTLITIIIGIIEMKNKVIKMTQ